MSQDVIRQKKYRQAAIVFSVCSFYYLLIFFWKGISRDYGYFYFVAIGLLIFFAVGVPYFVYKGSKGCAMDFAWIYAIRALGGTWHLWTGMGHEIEKYTLPTLYICCVMLFRAGWGDKNILKYADFWYRLNAFVIDSITLNIVVGFIYGPLIGGTTVSIAKIKPFVTIISIIIAWLYYALMESSSKQATLGKLVCAIKVTDMEGNPVSFGRASGRFFGKIPSAFLFFIGFLMAPFTEKKQGLHDKIAGCLVVNKN